jgi:hypothetical protein
MKSLRYCILGATAVLAGSLVVVWSGAASVVPITAVHEDFGRDPGWEGWNNRVRARNPPEIAQDFGWRPAGRTGAGPAGIGGVIWRSSTPAYYAMPLGPLSFRNSFSASGILALSAPAEDGNGFYIGFFSRERQGWRVWPSCGFRIGEVIQNKARFFLDYKTGLDKGAILNPDIEIPCDGSVHRWELAYEPEATVPDIWPDPRLPEYLGDHGNVPEPEILERAQKRDPTMTAERLRTLLLKARDEGLVDDWYRKGTYHLWSLDKEAPRMKGRVRFRFDDQPPVSYFLLPGHREEPADLTLFGVFNMQIYNGSMQFHLFDLTVNGKAIDLLQDPQWEGRGNQARYLQTDFHARQDFGYSQTNWAGKTPGEIGGRFWGTEVVDPLHAFYAGDVGRLTLDDPISFSGSINFVDGGVDGRMLIGYFNRAARLAAIEGEYKGNPPHQFMGLEIMDQTRIGYSFTAVCSPRQDIAFEERGPIIIPDRIKRRFTFRYDPAAGQAGRITVTLDKAAFTADLTLEQRKAGAVFDCFGLLNPRKGGKYVDAYFDDFTYDVRRPQGSQPVFHQQKITVVPYPKGGRTY